MWCKRKTSSSDDADWEAIYEGVKVEEEGEDDDEEDDEFDDGIDDDEEEEEEEDDEEEEDEEDDDDEEGDQEGVGDQENNPVNASPPPDDFASFGQKKGKAKGKKKRAGGSSKASTRKKKQKLALLEGEPADGPLRVEIVIVKSKDGIFKPSTTTQLLTISDSCQRDLGGSTTDTLVQRSEVRTIADVIRTLGELAEEQSHRIADGSEHAAVVSQLAVAPWRLRSSGPYWNIDQKNATLVVSNTGVITFKATMHPQGKGRAKQPGPPYTTRIGMIHLPTQLPLDLQLKSQSLLAQRLNEEGSKKIAIEDVLAIDDGLISRLPTFVQKLGTTKQFPLNVVPTPAGLALFRDKRVLPMRVSKITDVLGGFEPVSLANLNNFEQIGTGVGVPSGLKPKNKALLANNNQVVHAAISKIENASKQIGLLLKQLDWDSLKVILGVKEKDTCGEKAVRNVLIELFSGINGPKVIPEGKNPFQVKLPSSSSSSGAACPVYSWKDPRNHAPFPTYKELVSTSGVEQWMLAKAFKQSEVKAAPVIQQPGRGLGRDHATAKSWQSDSDSNDVESDDVEIDTGKGVRSGFTRQLLGKGTTPQAKGRDTRIVTGGRGKKPTGEVDVDLTLTDEEDRFLTADFTGQGSVNSTSLLLATIYAEMGKYDLLEQYRERMRNSSSEFVEPICGCGMLSDNGGNELQPLFTFVMGPLSTTPTDLKDPRSVAKHMWLVTESQQISDTVTVQVDEWVEVLGTVASKTSDGLKVIVKIPGDAKTYKFPVAKFHYTVEPEASPVSV